MAEAERAFSEALGLIRQGRFAGHTLADCLDWLAALADVQGRPRHAAVLFGAADAQWEASHAVRYAPDRAKYEVELGLVQAKLSPDEFAEAWAEGRRLDFEGGVEYALRDLRQATGAKASSDAEHQEFAWVPTGLQLGRLIGNEAVDPLTSQSCFRQEDHPGHSSGHLKAPNRIGPAGS